MTASPESPETGSAGPSDDTELFAWLVEDPESPEGWSPILGVLPGVSAGPTVFTHRNRSLMDKLKPFAVAHGEGMGQPVKLVRFQAVETLDEVTPGE